MKTFVQVLLLWALVAGVTTVLVAVVLRRTAAPDSGTEQLYDPGGGPAPCCCLVPCGRAPAASGEGGPVGGVPAARPALESAPGYAAATAAARRRATASAGSDAP